MHPEPLSCQAQSLKARDSLPSLARILASARLDLLACGKTSSLAGAPRRATSSMTCKTLAVGGYL